MNAKPSPFHDHLDLCIQCREHPFELCRVGAKLLVEEGMAAGKEVHARHEASQRAVRAERGAAK